MSRSKGKNKVADKGRRPRKQRVGRGQGHTNPILEGFQDMTRCRVIAGGEHCQEKHEEGGLFCTQHQGWVAEGKLDPECCPVFNVATGLQCSSSRQGESGAGRGYCSKDYQSGYRGTMPGTQRPQSSGGEREDADVSFRYKARAKELFDAVGERVMLSLGLKKTHLWMAMGYRAILEKGTPEEVRTVLADKALVADMLRLGLKEELVSRGVDVGALAAA